MGRTDHILRIVEGNKRLARRIIAFLKRRDKLTAREWRENLKPKLVELQGEMDNYLKSLDERSFQLSGVKAIQANLNSMINGTEEAFVQAMAVSQSRVVEVSIEAVEKNFLEVAGATPTAVSTIEDIMEVMAPLSDTMVRQWGRDAAKIVNSEVTLGLANGDSSSKVASRIQKKFGSSNMSLARAERIATTEMNRASAFAQQIRGEDMVKDNPNLRKAWLNSHKPQLRQAHLAVERRTAKNPIAVNGFFSVAGHKAKFPRDPALPAGEVANCGCTVIYLEPDDVEAVDLAGELAEDLQSK